MDKWVYIAVMTGFICSTFLAYKGRESFGFLMLAGTTALQLAYHWSRRKAISCHTTGLLWTC